jgi:hypothetical protein
VRDQVVDPARPAPVLRVRRPGHARRPHTIAWPQRIPEQWLPVHPAPPSARLAGAMNDEDGLRSVNLLPCFSNHKPWRVYAKLGETSPAVRWIDFVP